MSDKPSGSKDHVYLSTPTVVGDFATKLAPAIDQAAGLSGQFQTVIGAVHLGGNSSGAIDGVRILVNAFQAHAKMTSDDITALHQAMVDLQNAAKTIQAGYDAAQDKDKVSADEIKAAMNPATAVANPAFPPTTPAA